jgi:hypothetical protein
MGYPIEFRDEKGPDFLIEDEGTRLLEAKSRFNRTDPSGTSDKSARLTEMGLFSLLCRDAFPLLDRAFGEQYTIDSTLNKHLPLILTFNSYSACFCWSLLSSNP